MATASAPTELYFREFKKAKELASKLAGEASRSIQIKPFPGKNNGFSVIVPAAITSQFLGVVGAAAEGLINQRVNIGLFCSTPMVAVSRKVPRKKMMEMLLLGELIDKHIPGVLE